MRWRGIGWAGLLGCLLLPLSAHAESTEQLVAPAQTMPRASVDGGAVAYHGTSLAVQPAMRAANEAVAYAGPRPSYQVIPTGWQAGEPTLGVDRTGVAYVAAGDWEHAGPVTFDQWPVVHTPAGSASTQLRRAQFLASADGGRSWQLDQAPLAAGAGDGHPWFFDPYIYVDRDTGRVFEGTLTDAGGSYFDFSDDQGKTWTTAHMVVPGINDHETVFAGAVPPGSGLTATDPSFPKIVYYCVNQLLDAACARSTDGGRTYLPTGGLAEFPYNPTGANFGTTCEGLTGHGAADPQGRIFLPYPCQGPWIAISADAGATWSQVNVAPGTDIGTSARAGTTSVAVDRDGNLYYVWWDQTWFLPYLSISRDHGATWSRPRMVAPPGVAETNFTAVTAGDPGRVAITFVGTGDPDQSHADRPWSHYTVLSTDALSADPTFLATVTNPGGAGVPVHRGSCQGPCAGMLDYLSEPYLDIHGMVWAAAVTTCTAATGCTAANGTGAEATDQQGFTVHQLGGPSLLASGSAAAGPGVSAGAGQPASAATGATPNTATPGGPGAGAVATATAALLLLPALRRRRRRDQPAARARGMVRSPRAVAGASSRGRRSTLP